MDRVVRLSELFAEFPFPVLNGSVTDVPITQVVADSRAIGSGGLFVAMTGSSTDSHVYIPDAIQNGAVAVVGEKMMPNLGLPYLRVGNARRSLAYLAAAFYGYPARKLTMIGITGTDGKTTTSNLVYNILRTAKIKAGMISTVNAVIGDEVLDTGFHVTTPDSPDVQRYLAKMVEAGLTHAVLETTSHGWAQYRVDACEFDIGVVTNITHEHLDYHGTYENYRAAKARLFASLKETQPKKMGNIRLAVLNRDDSSYDFLRGIIKVNQISYGLTGEAAIRAGNVQCNAAGIQFNAIGEGYDVPVRSRLVGAYNVYNCLAALATGISGLGIDSKTVARGIENLPGVPGRMERIDLGQGFTTIVDFAHTPNALRAAIEASRQLTPGRVIVIFGSAGLRDKKKRRMMAEVAADLADVSILTAEDPRSETLDEILKAMADGAVSHGGVEGQTYWRIPDRGEAIRFAVRMARSGDLVIVCGKGHEQSMCFGTVEYPWDDRTAMRAALAELTGADGPGMPYLPTQEKK
jgi:UDP-N-acetylmuramoyl-L-alanyl-D-glutamate--2,6-diaminopimelate ligase